MTPFARQALASAFLVLAAAGVEVRRAYAADAHASVWLSRPSPVAMAVTQQEHAPVTSFARTLTPIEDTAVSIAAPAFVAPSGRAIPEVKKRTRPAIPSGSVASSPTGSVQLASTSAPLNTCDAQPSRLSPAMFLAGAKVKVVSVGRAYPYYGLPGNRCGGGSHFVTAELVAPFDGLAIGERIVMRLRDLERGSEWAGAVVSFSGLERAGRGPDGTFVYCGRSAPSLIAPLATRAP